MNETRRQTDATAQTQKQTPSVALRPSWSQVAIMFVCSIPLVAIVAGLVTAIPIIVRKESWGRDLFTALSPGLFLARLIEPMLSPARMFDFRTIYIGFLGNFLFYFGLFFTFVLCVDRRWRRKRAAMRMTNL